MRHPPGSYYSGSGICRAYPDEGVFVRWNDYEQVRVPGAGRARFWIQVHFDNKWVFPTLKPGTVEDFQPTFRALARESFGVEFQEGCAFA